MCDKGKEVPLSGTSNDPDAATSAYAQIGVTAQSAGRAPTGAHAQTSALSTMKGIREELPRIVASTPHCDVDEGLSEVKEREALSAETSPPRTRSGVTRTEKTRKRARLARASVPADQVGEGAPQATQCPLSSALRSNAFTLGTSHDLSTEFARLGLRGRSALTIPQQTSINTNVPSAQPHLAYLQENIIQPNVFSSIAPQATTTQASNMYTFTNAAVPSLPPLSNIGLGYNANILPRVGMTTDGSQKNSTFNRTVPVASHPSNLTCNGNMSNLMQNSMADITLSASHIAARQVMSKDLPIFSGNPEEWPLFITNYDQSTERCGFTDQENLIRLQKCLRGPALEAVRGKLMMPGTVSFAIETLRMLYGRPDVIYQTFQRKLRLQPSVKLENLDSLINFSLTIQNYRATMQAIGLGDYLNDPMLLNELVSKLPSDLKLDWGRYRVMRPRVDITVFDEWLFNLATCASQVVPLGPLPPPITTRDERRAGRRQERERIMLHEVVESEPERHNCPKCFKGHRLSECTVFHALSRDKRWRFIREAKLCIRCFGRHFIRRCNSKKRCGVDSCQQAHNPLLHSSYQDRTFSTNSKDSQDGAAQSSSVLFHAKENKHTLFRYIAVTLHNKGRSINTFAFIDEGSSCTILEHELAAELGLEGPTEELCLQWTGDITQCDPNSQRVALHISSQNPRAPKFFLANVRTVASLNLPVQSLDSETIISRNHLKNLPISPYRAIRARVLVGLDNLKISLPQEIRRSADDELIAAKCKIGWSVYGRNEVNGYIPQRIMHICSCQRDNRLEELVKSHFSLESIGIRETALLTSKEDERSHRIMTLTTKYLESEKRWETGLLWRYDNIELPDSLSMARRRLHCLEAKMARNSTLNDFMVATIRNYEQKGYIKKLAKEEVSVGGKSWYIPMFTVTNVNKNKTRLVWDAAAAVNKMSLNSTLMKGPDLLKSLIGVLIRFREQPVALCGDIREMYHQIRIIQEDQAAQKFLWREGDASKEPDVYVMQVMTFGATCSPSLANYVKNENARRFLREHPAAVETILNNTFVDDWLQSVPREDDMIKLATTVRDIHTDGGFEMRNWISNSSKVLLALTGQAAQADKYIEQPDQHHEKVLGMWWSPGADFLRFFEKFPKDVFDESKIPTKRQILRIVMTVFDPLGLLGFFIIYAKILMQEVWRSGVAWDEPIQSKELEKWWRWTRCLRSIPDVRITRCYPLASSADHLELHTFVDASVDAYAAAVYLRAIRPTEVSCSLVMSKTRVAPLKPISIPRLELMAAILGLRLAKFVISELSLRIERRIFWTDSKNVLHWIRSDARKFQQFVAVRIGEILEDSQANEWRWVPSLQNVADEGTKWTANPSFCSESRWFTGPKFLFLPENQWPTMDFGCLNENSSELLCHIDTTHRVANTLTIPSPDPHRFSKWEKLRRTQGYVLRFLRMVTKSRPRSAKFVELVNRRDIEGIEHIIIRNCQESIYGEEIFRLASGEAVSRRSTIYTFSPYLDEMGLLRVKGRIDAVKGVAYDCRRPIILPRLHQVTYLITDFHHRRFHHHHNEIVVNEMRQQFCISGLRALVRATAKRCQKCRNRRAAPHPPLMGGLPPERLATFSRPFTNTGVDYFGPLEIVVGRRREKRWGVLFTCLTVRAVHLEIAPSLSTDSFLLILKQFVARRGTPRSIWSDNGTNFRGANRVLKGEIERLSSDELEHRCPEIKWRFIPPASPHMGGSWERLVRSVKSVLMDILPDAGLREEVLRGAMADVELILNSRPLTYVPLDSVEMEALTPNHFLMGNSSGIRSRAGELNDGIALNKYFRISCQIADCFWKRWVREYLPCLTRRAKWFDKSPTPIALNDVVIIVDENAKRNTWKKGVVVDVHRSYDGSVRSAVIRTTDGLLTRPAVKLAKLDIKE